IDAPASVDETRIVYWWKPRAAQNQTASPFQQMSGGRPASLAAMMLTALRKKDEVSPPPWDASPDSPPHQRAQECKGLYPRWWVDRNSPDVENVGSLVSGVCRPLGSVDLGGADQAWLPFFKYVAERLFVHPRRHRVTGRPSGEYLTDAEV